MINLPRPQRTPRSLHRFILCLAVMGMAHSAMADSYQEAVDSADRPPADRNRDLTSKPGEVLRAVGAPTSGVVIDVFAGGGYYSEILSHLLGPDGTVYMHNNAAYLSFAGDAVEERLRSDRLQNVVRYDRELEQIDLADNSVDMVLMVMSYHDLYYKTDSWDLDPDGFFTSVHRILKPGAMLVVIDHAAKADTGNSAAQDLHRIDPQFARDDIQQRGFIFQSASELLVNPGDPLEANVFDESIRGKTSKFIYKFVEPGA